MARTAKCRDLAGTLVLDLAATGYRLTRDGINVGGRTWRRITASSPFVDGIQEVSRVLDGNKAEITVRLVASTWAGVETLRQALLTAVEPTAWLLEIVIDGVSYTYRASAADSVSGLLNDEIDCYSRIISLTVPVQPTPAITGI